MNVSGLRCDNPDCGYHDSTVTRDEYEKYINFPCPKCGAPILTQADYDAVLFLEKLEKNPIVKFLSRIFPGKAVVELHGNGWRGAEIRKPQKGEKDE